MRTDLIRQWREDIVGEWRSELAGTDLLDLKPSAARFTMKLNLRADGTADFEFAIPGAMVMPPTPAPPFPTKWELDDGRVLCILNPIPPMPDYGMPDWSEHPDFYDVLAVTDWSLSLSNRRFDGENVIVMRRVNMDEHHQRQVSKYEQALHDLHRLTKGLEE